jgi:hypothetical protein
MSWLDRDAALFDSSRLYRQAREGAHDLLREIEGHSKPFDSAVALLAGKETAFEISSRDGLDASIATLAQHLRSAAGRLSAYHILPLLVEATSRAYRSEDASWGRRWGPAIKIGAAFTYPTVQSSAAVAPTSARGAVAQFVLECAAMDQLLATRQFWEVGSSGHIIVTPATVELDPTLHRAAGEFAAAFRGGGRTQRLASAMPQIVANLHGVIDGIVKVLGGANPGAVPDLAETILGAIDDPNPAFWAGMLSRILVADIAADTRAAVGLEATGVAILGWAGLSVPGVAREVLEPALRALCWNHEWHAQQSVERYRHLLVRRPILRISSTEHLLITDRSLLLDSTTSFLERALVPDGGPPDVALRSSCFRKLLSEPFEQEVVEVFRSHGFRAGTVTDDGGWYVPHRINLSEVAGPPPGEIDVFAVHPRGFAIIAECKVLALPTEWSRVRNLATKLGIEDSEGFRSKLRTKLTWLAALDETTVGYLDGAPLGIIVLDRYLPGLPEEGPELVVPLDVLDDAIARLVAGR